MTSSMHKTKWAPLVLVQHITNPTQRVPVMLFGRPRMCHSGCFRIWPSFEYWECVLYGWEIICKLNLNPRWSNPVRIMSDWSHPDSSIVTNGHMPGDCNGRRLMRKSSLRRPSADNWRWKDTISSEFLCRCRNNIRKVGVGTILVRKSGSIRLERSEHSTKRWFWIWSGSPFRTWICSIMKIFGTASFLRSAISKDKPVKFVPKFSLRANLQQYQFFIFGDAQWEIGKTTFLRNWVPYCDSNYMLEVDNRRSNHLPVFRWSLTFEK